MVRVATVAVAIAAHPARQAYVDDTLEILGYQPVDVAYDRHGPPSRDPARCWATARSAWEMAAIRAAQLGASHCLVLQDDAVPCSDMVDGLTRALDRLPERDAIVSLYFGTNRPSRGRCIAAAALARAHNASWIQTPTLYWGVAVCVPTGTVEGMLAWCERKHLWADDKRISRYYTERLRYRTYCTWPSLVDHRQGPSLLGPRDMGRRAHEWHQGSALDLDWAGPVVDATASPPRVRASVHSAA